MKSFKMLVAMTFAAVVVAGVAMAADKPKFAEGSCCAKAQKAGKECKHPCCVEAAKDGKVCEKCNKKK